MQARNLVPDRFRPVARSAKSRLTHRFPKTVWRLRHYEMPPPPAVKRAVLHRYGRATDTWIETGTHMGDTTDFLARSAKHVYSIEPEPTLASRAKHRFHSRDNVTIIEGLSEEHIDNVLNSVSGPVSLWLDGHYSAGNTFQGPQDTPIRQELDAVARHRHTLGLLTVCIDDVRIFDPRNPEDGSYPSRSWLVQWADSCGFDWTIEHDIFVATSSSAGR